MAARRKEVVNALRTDTAEALSIPVTDVTEVTTKENVNMLVATLVVLHPAEQTTTVVQKELSSYEYPRVWALYDDVTDTQVDVMKTRGADSNMSNLLTKRFDGVDWDLALDAYPDRLRSAFVRDTADVLQTSEDTIVVDGMMLGSLLVQYRVRGLSMSEANATSLCDNYAYPNVWALYRSRESGGIPASSRATTTALGQTPRRSRQVADPQSDVDEEGPRREAEEAARQAEEARKAEEEAERRAREAEEAARQAEEEANRTEEEALRSIQRAREKRDEARRSADAAKQDKDRKAAESLEEAQRALEAAQKAQEAAEEARRRRVKPLGAEEMETEEETIAYLRKAVADARRERDEYMELAERAEEERKNNNREL
ncbi:mitotubule-associated protein Gb4 [Angomonas deanei]|uniref:Flagellar attachment zone protein 1 conserved domain-containing protein n=1 Tax=Angomonas deanei TaxID=59799 RepID=A0A7G2CP53_9TRYP|nr:mitotubule-associated protein Gb4 [Angomonas deanei]CAD2221275.1 hypothetical protein, conserved [Angomonas deanei]|eukprot:EPY18407.1 mitotubule-associated protein Gb4 [Angomonas deanei]